MVGWGALGLHALGLEVFACRRCLLVLPEAPGGPGELWPLPLGALAVVCEGGAVLACCEAGLAVGDIEVVTGCATGTFAGLAAGAGRPCAPQAATNSARGTASDSALSRMAPNATWGPYWQGGDRAAARGIRRLRCSFLPARIFSCRIGARRLWKYRVCRCVRQPGGSDGRSRGAPPR